jgi:hypothetical protein
LSQTRNGTHKQEAYGWPMRIIVAVMGVLTVLVLIVPVHP